MKQIQCPHCNAIFTSEALYCPSCGMKLEEKALPYSPENQNDENINDHQKTVRIEAERETRLIRKEETVNTLDACLEYQNKRYSINKDLFRIGALKEECDFVLDSDVVSGSHAEIIHYNDEFYIKDLDSLNGTFLNDVRLPKERKVELLNNDKITFADIDVTFHISD